MLLCLPLLVACTTTPAMEQGAVITQPPPEQLGPRPEPVPAMTRQEAKDIVDRYTWMVKIVTLGNENPSLVSSFEKNVLVSLSQKYLQILDSEYSEIERKNQIEMAKQGGASEQSLRRMANRPLSNILLTVEIRTTAERAENSRGVNARAEVNTRIIRSSDGLILASSRFPGLRTYSFQDDLNFARELAARNAILNILPPLIDQAVEKLLQELMK